MKTELESKSVVAEDQVEVEKILSGNQLKRMWYNYKKSKLAVLGLIIVFYLLL